MFLVETEFVEAEDEILESGAAMEFHENLSNNLSSDKIEEERGKVEEPLVEYTGRSDNLMNDDAFLENNSDVIELAGRNDEDYKPKKKPKTTKVVKKATGAKRGRPSKADKAAKLSALAAIRQNMEPVKESASSLENDLNEEQVMIEFDDTRNVGLEEITHTREQLETKDYNVNLNNSGNSYSLFQSYHC